MPRPAKQAAPKLAVVKNGQCLNPNLKYLPGTKVIAHARPVWCSEHHFTGPWPCSCKAGPQVIAALSWQDEVLMGGGRGSAKTEPLLYCMALRDNYFCKPHYTGLLLRAQANDLGDLLDRAEAMWGPTGAVLTRGNPAKAIWPSGAQVVFGHFAEDGWKKFVGPQYIRIGIDQLEQMADKEIWVRLGGSCRSKWADLKPQMFATANPGGGDIQTGAPGQGWIIEYWGLEWYTTGKCPPNLHITLKKPSGKTTLFIPSTWRDNPYLAHYHEHKPEAFPGDPETGALIAETYRAYDGPYVKWLNGLEPESLRAAWRDGSWTALQGQFFRSFRNSMTAREGEPENAHHIYDPEKVRLEPWFHRWLSIDWGYIHPSVLLQYCKAPWDQTYVEREIALNRVEPQELGYLIGYEMRAVLDGLQEHHMALFFSPDAFSKRESDYTIADQIKVGICKVLGPDAAFVADLTEEERQMSPEEALNSLRRRRQQQTRTSITIMKASTDRVAGWMHLQTMMRWTSLQPVSKPDMELAHRLLEEKGIVEYTNYVNSPEFSQISEVLPKLQIHPDCRLLRKTIPMAMHANGTNDVEKRDATENTPGDDALDSLRMGTLSEERQGSKTEPLDMRIDKRTALALGDYTGWSEHAKAMAFRHAQFREEHPEKAKPAFMGVRNRMEGRRMLAAQRYSERTRI